MASTTFTPTSGAPAVPAPITSDRVREPAVQAFWVLRIGFAVAPILFGLDKFTHVLTNWDKYLAPEFSDVLGVSTHTLMYVVGAIEVVAGLVVALRPRFGGYLVALWLAGIIVNLLMIGGYYDVALRDFGLFLGAIALARLSAGVVDRTPPLGGGGV